MIVRSAPTPVVTRTFLGYLESRLGLQRLYYAEPPKLIPDGWETYVYRFRLGSRGELPAALRRPLILRVYATELGLPHLRHEHEVQAFMHRRGYPVAKPILIEESSDLFGGPFLLMECLPGRTLLDLMLNQPWRIFTGPGQLAADQVRLHELAPDGFPELPLPFPDCQLEEIREQVERFDLGGLRAGLKWLDQRHPGPSPDPRILHLDYQPVNVLYHRGQCSGVLDWSESAVGDREADVAATLVLLQTAPVELSNPFHRVCTLSGRWLLWRLYRYGYRNRLPLDLERLSYYMALTALRRLARWGTWLRGSPCLTGYKPCSARYISTRRVRLLRHCFARHAGVTVDLKT